MNLHCWLWTWPGFTVRLNLFIVYVFNYFKTLEIYKSNSFKAKKPRLKVLVTEPLRLEKSKKIMFFILGLSRDDTMENGVS